MVLRNEFTDPKEYERIIYIHTYIHIYVQSEIIPVDLN